MDIVKRKIRTLRVKKMNRILQKLYSAPTIALNYSTPWELLVAVQLSAQCTDIRVNMVTRSLFQKYKTIQAYAEASQEEMEQMVYATGFFRNKAKNIRGSARMILEVYDGEVPGDMDSLLTLPGVARKTANVVLANAFHVFDGIAVDTHVRRFAIRFDLTDHTDPTRIEKDLMAIMPKREWWGFNHRLVHYGRDFCHARAHDCTTHPLTAVFPEANGRWPKAH